MSEEKEVPNHWHDLTEEQRRAILARADADIFWRALFARLTWLKTFASMLIVFFALWSVFSEAAAGWLQGLQNMKPPQ